ncbi:MAG: DUF4124 domain-containing protein [Xanthomonadales bacterium]|nr:DUF4124 domain-containing protein [Xanthomonadales bacterium]
MYRFVRPVLILLCAGLATAPIAFAENVYRWTDENGKVHYGRTLPPEYANKPYEILNDQGVVIERVTDPLARQKEPPKEPNPKNKKPPPLFTEDEVRLRSDRLLVLRYHSIADIEDAMQVEIDQLGYDRRLINQTMLSAMQSLEGQVRNAADRQRAGMEVEADIEGGINKLRQRIRRNERSLAELDTREQKIRADFSREIERYRYLENGGEPGMMPDPEAEPAAEADTEAQG